MQKKILLTFSLLFAVSNSSASQYLSMVSEFSGLKTILSLAGIAAIGATGRYSEKLNEEYEQRGATPDTRLRLLKLGAAGLSLLGLDIITGENNMIENGAKLAAFAVSSFAITDKCALIVKRIPLIGALFTDPMRERTVKGANGSDPIKQRLEQKDIGAAARVTAAYIPLKAVMTALAYRAAGHFGF